MLSKSMTNWIAGIGALASFVVMTEVTQFLERIGTWHSYVAGVCVLLVWLAGAYAAARWADARSRLKD